MEEKIENKILTKNFLDSILFELKYENSKDCFIKLSKAFDYVIEDLKEDNEKLREQEKQQ